LSDTARLQREQAFHDERFTEETRTGQGRFYASVQPVFERYRELVYGLGAGKDVLEYGCATGTVSLRLAPHVHTLRGIDLSPVGIEQTNAKAESAGLAHASFYCMNAESLTFPDNSFDLVFGSGIVHHLDLTAAYSEVARVLRPGGHAVFVEPLGHNPVINAYRRATPAARTPDEHPLLKRDFDQARVHFASVDLDFFGLLSVLGVVAGRPNAVEAFSRALSHVDRLVLRGPLRWQAWFTVMCATAPST